MTNGLEAVELAGLLLSLLIAGLGRVYGVGVARGEEDGGAEMFDLDAFAGVARAYLCSRRTVSQCI